MPDRLGVDFGTSKTVIALLDDAQREAAPISVPRYSQAIAISRSGRLPIIPSLIHYAADGRRWLGAQVHSNQLYESDRTIRWMKRDIVRRNDEKRHLSDREISPMQAGQDFLTGVLSAAAEGRDWSGAEVAFTLPTDSYEHYRDWLSAAARGAGLPPPRFIDSASAAMLGYECRLKDGQVYLVVDFGAGSLSVSILLVENIDGMWRGRPAQRYHVLGKAGADFGSATIDQWLYEEVLARNSLAPDSDEARHLCRSLLADCERCKDRLITADSADVSVLNADTGLIVSAEFQRGDLERLFESRGLYRIIEETVRGAMDEAATHGCQAEHITAALMAGGGSLIPSVRRHVGKMLGENRVKFHRPLDAAARGAAAFAAGAEIVDYLQHDYAIRHINPVTGEHDFRPIVRRGTVYPTAEPVATMLIKASREDQNELGIALFEVSASSPVSDVARDAAMELKFDASGSISLGQVPPEDRSRRSRFWLNQDSARFLRAEAPITPGEARYEVRFDVDAERRLLITAQDLKSGRIVIENQPVTKLS